MWALICKSRVGFLFGFPIFLGALCATIVGCNPEQFLGKISNGDHSTSNSSAVGGGDGDYKVYQFCTWNMENFFDDQADPKSHDEMENWYAKNPDMFKLKVKHLTEAIMMMNQGVGPDILCMCEVESERSVDALRQSVNAALEAKGLKNLAYKNILFKPDNTGRRFGPAILTRLPVDANRTQQLGKNGYRRVIEGHINVNGYDLTVIAAHWTSRVNANTDSHRMTYAETCYGRFRAIATSNPEADVIVCGDFNDEFKDSSVQHGLHASNDPEEVIRGEAGDQLKLLDLSARFDGTGAIKGTIYGKGHWSTFDHICVSRGMLDGRGWVCDPKTTAIFAPKELRKTGKNSRGEPFPFGNPKTEGERGFSDHFAVNVQIRVQNFK